MSSDCKSVPLYWLEGVEKLRNMEWGVCASTNCGVSAVEESVMVERIERGWRGTRSQNEMGRGVQKVVPFPSIP
jgi:hypothetical protein